MTALLYLSILLASTVTATTYRKNYRNSFDSGESYSSFGNGYFGDETSSRTGPSKREFNGSPYDADDYIPPKIGIKHNNDYSALGDGYQEYAGAGGSGGNGAISYSQVVSEHRPVQRYNPSSQSSQYPSQYSSQSSSTFGSPPSPNYRGLTAEGTNVVEKPAVPGLYKVPIPVIPAFDRPILPLVPVAPVIAPVKYPIQFVRPFAYLAPEGKAFQQGHHQQGHHQQGHHQQGFDQQGFNQQGLNQQLAPVKQEQPEYLLTKVPLVYHATYSETPQSGFNHNQKFNDGPNNHGSDFNLGPADNFKHGAANHQTNGFQSSVNHGHHNFANNPAQNHNFHHNQHLPSITTPGTPAFNNFNPPVPLVPTPTPYHHQHQHFHN
ncbi:Hypothetical protein NTJ_13885 [Nesidiocoris tenuis]|uniref:DUF4794 domain-containing protein n=1 Tax=Nesidiocoris tenuis TaxID=355587 RepID=A0ABN7B9K5_9HEMI|nr:Hypothetical protein NTJ_13885 [Nesidiocoris tenuis]